MSNTEKISIRLGGKVRDDLRTYADDNDMSYTEALMALLPEETEGEALYRGESVVIDIRRPAHERLVELAGEGVDYGDVIAHFLYEEIQDD